MPEISDAAEARQLARLFAAAARAVASPDALADEAETLFHGELP